jgi:hypothetical protein
MRIKTSIDEIKSGIDMISTIVTDNLLQDDLKNIIFWVNGNKVYLVAYNIFIVSCTELTAEIQYCDCDEKIKDQPEKFFQIRAKALSDIIATFAGLSRTLIEYIEFDFRDDSAMLHVQERAKTDVKENADMFFQTSKFRLSQVKIKETFKSEISKIEFKVGEYNISNSEIQFRDLFMLYLDCLIPTIVKGQGDGIATRITFKDDYVFTFPQQYVAMMKNKLNLSGFCLSNTTAKYISNFSKIEDFTIHKDDSDDIVVLTLMNSKSIAVIKTINTAKAFNIAPYTKKFDNGVSVDRYYFFDVLKRISVNNDAVTIAVDIDNKTFKIFSKNLTQNIPIDSTKGTGEYVFSIAPSLLGNLVMSHATTYDAAQLYVELNKSTANDLSKESITMIIRDSSGYCTTAISGMRKIGGDVPWF